MLNFRRVPADTRNMTIIEAIAYIKRIVVLNPHCGFYDAKLKRKSVIGTLGNWIHLDFCTGDSESDHTFVLRKTVYNSEGTEKLFEDRLSIQDLESTEWEMN